MLQRCVDGPVAQVFAFGGHVEHVAGKQFGDEFFVVVVDLLGPIHPTDGVANGGFGFEHRQWQPVDIQHQVGAALGGSGAERDLGGGDVLVVIQVFKVNQADGDVLVVLAKGHGAVAAQPSGEFFVGADESITAHGCQDGAQFVEYFVGAFGAGGDFRVEPDERLHQPGFEQYLVDLARQVERRDVMPARAFGIASQRQVGRSRLADRPAPRPKNRRRRDAGQQVHEVVFDGVLLVEHGIHP